MKFFKVIITLFVILLIAGCSGQIRGGSVDGPVKIGVIAPLTGNAAELGEHIQTGLMLANEDLGEKYDLIFEDSMCFDTSAALSAAEKFVDIDKTELVIGPLCAPAYQAASGVFNREGVGFMHTSGVTPSFVQTSGDFGIPGLSTTIHSEDEFLADFIVEELEITKMGVFIWHEEWAVEHRAGFVKRFTELGGEVVFDEKFEITEQDFRTSLLKLEASGAEGVFIVALNFQNADIVKQMKEMDLDLKIFGQFEIEDPAFIAPTGDAAEGVMYVYPKIDTSRPEVKQFKETYRAKFGHEPNYYAYIGYDSLKLYDWAITGCGEAESACVISKIRSAKDFPGVSGLMTFNPDRTLSRDFEMKVIRGGQFVSLE